MFALLNIPSTYIYSKFHSPSKKPADLEETAGPKREYIDRK